MKWNQKGLTKLGVILAFFLIVVWLAFGKRGLIHLYRMEGQRQEYRERIQELERKNHELLQEIERLRTDDGYIESVARKELNLLKEDEVHYHFAGKNRSGATGPAEPPPPDTGAQGHAGGSSRSTQGPASE
jgi:cell division protein FtsB